MGHPEHNGSPGGQITGCDAENVRDATQGQDGTIEFEGAGQSGDVADNIGSGLQGHGRSLDQPVPEGREGEERHPWSGGVWIDCPDGKQRLIEPSIRLLAHGIPARVGRLRAYGNAIVPQVAAEVIGAYMDCYPTGWTP